MAPYTMKINIKNPVRDVAYIGSARLAGDGYVTTTGYNVTALSTSEGASLAKGGGHEGLFIATLFSVVNCPQNLLVWSSMSANSDGQVIVQVAFVDASLSVTSLPHTCYYDPATLGLKSDEAVSKVVSTADETHFVAKVEDCVRTYPDASCAVSVGYFRVK